MSDSHAVIERKPIPPELDRWNWGAFLLSWIWGIGNETYIALLALVPVLNVIMPFVLGAKGSQWAWQNGRWDSVEHFRRVQRGWAKWGAIIWIALIVVFGGFGFGGFYLFKHSQAYQLGVTRLEASPAATDALGTPITTGFPNGSIKIDGTSGTATLSFSASGPRAAGVVSLEAIKKDDVWSLTTLRLKLDGSDSDIDLLNAAKKNSR